MRTVFRGAAVAPAIAVGSAVGVSGAQGPVDHATQTLSINQSATYPTNASYSGSLFGTIDTHALGADTQTLVYTFSFGPGPDGLSAFAAGGSVAQQIGRPAGIHFGGMGQDVALTVLFGPLGLLKHGNDVVHKAGTEANVYTDLAVTVHVPVVASATRRKGT